MSVERKNSLAVIIATKNRRSLLKRALLSIEKQDERPDEIIVIDDGSNDGTQEFLHGALMGLGLKVFRNEMSRGVNASRNLGIKAATSKWLLFLDDDDELLPGAIMLIKKKIDETPDKFSIFYLNNQIKTDHNEFVGGFQFLSGDTSYEPTYEDIMEKFGLKGDSSAVMKKAIFSSGNYLFPEDINGFESLTIKRIAKDGHLIRYYPDLLKKVDLSSSFEHLSSTSSKYNPRGIIRSQIEDLHYHYDYYKENSLLAMREFEISKLAYKNFNLSIATNHLIQSIIQLCNAINIYFFRTIGLQRWIRLGLRYRLILNLKQKNFKFNVPFFGYAYMGNLADYIDKYVFYFGAYEREELLFLSKYINSGSVVLDVGANTGHHSLFFSRHAGKVYSFEPYTKLFEMIKKKIYRNFISNIYVYNFGLGEVDEEVDFFASTGRNEGVGSFVSSSDRVNIGRMHIRQGDKFLNDISLEQVDLIKIDVEGYELHVLEGLKKTIDMFKPVIFVELNSSSQNKLKSVLGNIISTYDLFTIDANNPFLIFFNKPGCVLKRFKPSNEMQNILMIPKSY